MKAVKKAVNVDVLTYTGYDDRESIATFVAPASLDASIGPGGARLLWQGTPITAGDVFVKDDLGRVEHFKKTQVDHYLAFFEQDMSSNKHETLSVDHRKIIEEMIQQMLDKPVYIDVLIDHVVLAVRKEYDWIPSRTAVHDALRRLKAEGTIQSAGMHRVALS